VLPIFAQATEPNSLRDTIDSLARTPLSQVLLFVAFFTIIRLGLVPYLLSVEPHKRTGAFRVGMFINELSDAVVYAGVFVFMIIRPFVVQTFMIPTGSMLDALQLSDYIIANKAIYRYSEPKVGDIVVFKPPEIAKQEQSRDVDFIKRCIGAPGDTIEVKDGWLYRNGTKVDEPYITRWHDPVSKKMSLDFKIVKYKNEYWPLLISGEYVNADPARTVEHFYLNTTTEMDLVRALPAEPIPAGRFLMLGDNREFSLDGRSWGLVTKDQIIGKSMVIWLPLNRWRVTK
jgi:signal peptidase I